MCACVAKILAAVPQQPGPCDQTVPSLAVCVKVWRMRLCVGMCGCQRDFHIC